MKSNLTPAQLVDRAGGIVAAAKLCEVSRQSIYNWMKKGEIPNAYQALARERMKKVKK